MKRFNLIIITVLISWGTFISWSVYFKHQWATPASDYCSFKLPNQYFLQRDSVTGKYAILFMHIDVFPYYLREVETQVIDDYSIIDGTSQEATLFNDSCEAKRCLVQALNEKVEFNSKNKRIFRTIK